MVQIQGFNPIIDEHSKVLILGSMPSVISIEKNEYYANPKNQFWTIIYSVFDNSNFNTDKYEQKVDFINSKNIALWDVINSCEREGSLDKNIKNEKANDFEKLFKQFPNISCVVFNGLKAYETFKKSVGFDFKSGITYKLMQSTSPVPGKNIKRLDEKIKEWKFIYEYLNK